MKKLLTILLLTTIASSNIYSFGENKNKVDTKEDLEQAINKLHKDIVGRLSGWEKSVTQDRLLQELQHCAQEKDSSQCQGAKHTFEVLSYEHRAAERLFNGQLQIAFLGKKIKMLNALVAEYYKKEYDLEKPAILVTERSTQEKISE